MTKIAWWALVPMTTGILAMGCAVGADPPSERDEAESPALEAQSTGLTRTTIYYSSDLKGRSVVGGCTFSSCPPKGTSCWGAQTAYSEVFTTACSY